MTTHDDTTECPACKVSWEMDKNIYDFYRALGHTKKLASEEAEMFGCTKENPRSFSQNVIGVEISGWYDGIAFYRCTSCTYRMEMRDGALAEYDKPGGGVPATSQTLLH